MPTIQQRLYWSRPGRIARAGAVALLAPLARRRLDRAGTHAERVNTVATVVPGGAHQIPEEIAAFLGFLEDRAPVRILEIGVADGGTNALLARCAPTVELLIGIDPDLRWPRALRALRPRRVDLELVEGLSQDPDVVRRVAGLLGDHQLDVLLIDGDHTYAGAMGDYERYRSFVRPGGVIAFHDIIEDSRTRGGPPTIAYTGDVPKVWAELAAATAGRTWEFVRDRAQDGCGIGVLEVV